MRSEYVINRDLSEVVQNKVKSQLAGDFDVIIAGGGVAGFAAAISASRAGVKTCLIEKSQVIGGTATSGLMNLFYTPYKNSRGIAKQLIDRLILENAAYPTQLVPFESEICKIVMFEMLEEANVTLYLDSLIVDVLVKKDIIKGLVIENKSGRQVLLANKFIDATGDADICAFAGVPFIKGRESDNKLRPMTLLFMVAGMDVNKLIKYVKQNLNEFSPDPNQCRINKKDKDIRIFGFFNIVKKAKEAGDLYDVINYFRMESIIPERGVGTVNTILIYNVDGTNIQDIIKAQIIARKQEKHLIKFMRKYIPGCENCFIITSAHTMGVRETRRINGDFKLSEKDILLNKSYSDTIAIDCIRSIPGCEGHSPDGNEGDEHDKSVRGGISQLIEYEIPYRCLIPKKITNLLVAGRCISTTHTGSKYTRNMPACMYTGQATGIAAALSILSNVPVKDVDIKRVQKHLGL